MAYTTYTGDTDIIASLGTSPAERGLTTDQFKAKFDEFATAFVAWFNATHIVEADAHLADNAAHNATSAATASRLIVRDSAGRAKVAAPSAEDDIALKSSIFLRQGGDLDGAINYNNLTPNRIYNVFTITGATNPPPEAWCILEFYATSQYMFQRATQVSGNKIYIRSYSTSWSAWTEK